MKISNFAQYSSAVAKIKSIQTAGTTPNGELFLTEEEQAERAKYIKAVNAVDPAQLSEMKIKHQSGKLSSKENNIGLVYKAAIKSATENVPEVDIKALVTTDVALAIDDILQLGIAERARKASGLLGQIEIVQLPSAKYRPQPVEVTVSDAEKWAENATTTVYTVTGTSAFAQASASDSGFMGIFDATTEAVADPATDLVLFVGGSIDKTIFEGLSAELIGGDSDLGEFGGVFTDLIDSDNSYVEALKPLALRQPFIFGAVKTGSAGSLGTTTLGVAGSVLDNVKGLITYLPIAYRSQNPVFIMNDDCWSQIQFLRSQDAQAFMEITADSIDGYKVVLDEDVPDNSIAFGLPKEALGVGVYSTIDKVNPYLLDGLVRFTRKSRLKSWVKLNDAMVMLLPLA